ncbi:MAG: alanine--tRNA ligase [Desulfobulbaceae bacterium]|nr:alanine--tRNA ligase [Desulfobulbaceae bacterium]
MMTGNEIRARFLKYFSSKGHDVVESSSLVPHDDPTLLFTNAGMVQFKRVFMGEEHRDYVRSVTCQRCVRAGGKHNDLENVGHTARHHTFFEMLGNFSFGDYFKKEAIDFAWEFLTREMGLDPAQLWVSVFRDDDEAYALWTQIEGLPEGRIIRLGEKDNFWAMGDTGPCGPCSEIHIDLGEEVGCGRPECAVGCDCDRYLELWNLVFMQYYRETDGKMTPLPKPSIDTGMGLERITAVMQGKHSNFDSDLFTPLIGRISGLCSKKYGSLEKDDIAMRVIADHARATTFLVADGVLPSNEGRGYVLRRIMRRAIRYGRFLGMKETFFAEICLLVAENMGESYPHLIDAGNLLGKVVTNEETRFGETLDYGLTILSEEIEKVLRQGGERAFIAGDFIFKLYDTYGFPVDIIRDVALEKGITIDEAGYHRAMEIQREQSKRSWQSSGVEHLAEGIIELINRKCETEFVGYTRKEAESTVDGMIDAAGKSVDQAAEGEKVRIYCPLTPFYAESGGQVGDTGTINGPNGSMDVVNTVRVADNLILHEGRISRGTIAAGDPVKLCVTSVRRNDIALNHTATHLLQAALKELLGRHIKQAGSLVEEARLRFDFTHFSPLTQDEVAAIELMVNREIRRNTPVSTELQSKDQAVAAGATALFGEKYANEVRVVSVGDFSKELCGGTHVGATGDIGFFKILTETGIAAGVRRIEAVTGARAVEWVQDLYRQAAEIENVLSGPLDTAPEKIRMLQKHQKDLEKRVAALTSQLALADLDQLFKGAVDINGIKVVTAELTLDSARTLREIGDRVRDKLGTGVAVLGGVLNDKAALLALVSSDLTGRIKAGDIVRSTAAIVGGKGGGRPDMAQAGGPMADKLPEAIRSVPDLVRNLIKD